MKFLSWLLLILVSSISFAEFSQLSKRYLTAHDFQNKLYDFMFVDNDTNLQSALNQYCKVNMKQLGLNNAATSQPISLLPNSASIQLIQSCISDSLEFIKYNMQSTQDFVKYKSLANRLIPALIIDKYTQNLNNNDRQFWMQITPVSALTSDEQYQIASFLVEKSLGVDDVILSYGIIQDTNAFRQYLVEKNQNKTVFEFTKSIVNELFLRDEFLTY